MNGDATLYPFEARLRAVLADQQPIGGAPATLRARVNAIPERVGAIGWTARLRASASSHGQLAALVGVLVVIAVAASLRSFVGPLTGAGASPNALPFDPTVEGPGLVHDPIPMLQVVQGLAVLLAVALVRRWRSIGGFETWRDMGRGLTLILLLGGAALELQPGIANMGGSEGTALGYASFAVNPPPGADGPTVYYESAEPGAPLIAFFDVTNVSALPITLEGVVASPGGGPHWTALAVATSRNVFPDMAHLRAFTPQVVQPGELFTVYLVGKAGACAFGPGYTLDTPGVTGFASLSRNVDLVYSTLGLSTRTTVEMPMQLVEPQAEHCP